MRRLILPLSALLLVATLAAGLLLPHLVAQFNDTQRLDLVHIELQEEQDAPTTHTMLEKMQLVFGRAMKVYMDLEEYKQVTTSPSYTVVPLSTGNQFDSTTVQSHCLDEIKKLQGAGLLPDAEFPIPSEGSMQAAPLLYLSTLDQSASVIVWNLYFESTLPSLSLLLDDETGKIISFNCSEAPVLTEEQFRWFGEYLGLTYLSSTAASDDKYASYYMAEYQDSKGAFLQFPAYALGHYMFFGDSAVHLGGEIHDSVKMDTNAKED